MRTLLLGLRGWDDSRLQGILDFKCLWLEFAVQDFGSNHQTTPSSLHVQKRYHPRRCCCTSTGGLQGRTKTKAGICRDRAFRLGGGGLLRRPAQQPTNLLESIVTLSEMLRFTYSETLGKWLIGDLAFGINHFMRKQGNLLVASVYGGSDCVQLKGAQVIAELHELLRLLTFCMLFFKKPFPVFLDSAGFSLHDVLLHKPKAELLKPAFTIIRDTQSKCFLLLIRGTHSI